MSFAEQERNLTAYFAVRTVAAVEPEVLAGQPAVSIAWLFWAVDDARVYCVGSSEASLAVSACVSFVALSDSAALR